MITAGDGKYCFVQLKLDKRRRRRNKTKPNEHTKPLWDRVSYILKYGTTCDYTHPREVDPYWKKLYELFELLTYYEKSYVISLDKANYPISKSELLFHITQIIKISKIKKDIVFYLMNFLELLYGSVLKNRFYGWKNKYGSEMVSLFKEISLEKINKLTFNSNQTRCSVYFYQIYWLSGLVFTKNIRTELAKKYLSHEDQNRGQRVFNEDEDFISNLPSTINLDDPESIEEESEEEIEIIKEEDKSEHTDGFNEDHFNIENTNFDKTTHPLSETPHSIQENKENLAYSILAKFNISKDWLYKANEKQIGSLGKKIKNLIKKNLVQLSKEEEEFLKKILNKA